MSQRAGAMAGADVLVVAEQLRRRVPGGIGTYVKGLLGGLVAVDATERPSIGVLASAVRGADPLGTYPFPRSVVHIPSRLVATSWRHGVGRIRGARLVHATSFALPPSSAEIAMTVHDLAFLHHPEAYPPRGMRWHVDALERALERATSFVVPSDVVRTDLITAGATPSSVLVIPEGADHLPAPDVVRTAALLQRAGVTGRFLLSVGTLEPRKNLGRLLQAFAAAKASFNERLPLVVVGPAGWGSSVSVDTADVVFLGAVTDGELAGLYATATLSCYVPLEEGFGLPVVESMHAGVPVLSSDVPSAGGATILVDPSDVESIASGMVSGVTDATRRAEAIAAGALRASSLKWSDVAVAHVAFWRTMLEARSS